MPEEKKSAFSDDLLEKVDKAQEKAKEEGKVSQFIKAGELIKKEWEVVSIEIVVSNDPRFGALEKDALLKQGILNEGETLRYTFKDDDGTDRRFESKGMAFYLGMKGAFPQPGDRVQISKEGTMEKTRYHVSIVL